MTRATDAGAGPVVGFLAGVLLVGIGLLRFGRLVRFMPGLVVVGFTGGIAISIAFGQLNALLGLRGTNAEILPAVIAQLGKDVTLGLLIHALYEATQFDPETYKSTG